MAAERSMDGGKTALILTGGGARAAYQVGVLQAVRELLPDPRRNPFPILCGTSAGAINAGSLACHAEDFGAGVDFILRAWQDFHVDQVYRSDAAGIGASGARWLSLLMFGWLTKHNPRSLLDNTPLRHLLEHNLDFNGIGGAIDRGALFALSITASGYSSGESISFFQGGEGIELWRRTQRAGARVKIGVDHLMASSAIPFIFPAGKIHREYFGDGSMRQIAPISPAIHLGAERILVVGAGRMNGDQERMRGDAYPSLAQVAGHVMSSIFLDSLHVDLERLQRINKTLSIIPAEIRESAGLPLRPIETLVIAPTQRLDYMAARHVKSLPWAVRLLLRGVGATSKNGSALASYLLFEPPYTRALIELGYTDTMARREEVADFLQLGQN
jgi:NTE family protein